MNPAQRKAELIAAPCKAFFGKGNIVCEKNKIKHKKYALLQFLLLICFFTYETFIGISLQFFSLSIKTTKEVCARKEGVLMKVRIALGSDHRGFALKEYLKKVALHEGVWIDCGAHTDIRSDYPIFAKKVVDKIMDNEADCAILLCGTGIGMAIAANRYAGMYAGVVWNENVARRAREDDNCNILVIPADYVTEGAVYSLVRAWLSAQFKEGRYHKRLAMIDTK